MKVFAINTALNQKTRVEKYHSTANFAANSPALSSNYNCSIPFYPLLPVSPSKSVSFGISLPFKHGYTCPCCGDKMIDPSLINLPKSVIPLSSEKVIWLIERAKPKMRPREKRVLEDLKRLNVENPDLPYNSLLKKIEDPPLLFLNHKNMTITLPTMIHTKKLIDYIGQYEDFMHGTEKKVFLRVKELHNIYPKDSIQELLLKMRPAHLKVLQQDQIKVFDRIEAISGVLSSDSRTRIKQLLQDEREMALSQLNDEDPFKRKKFLNILTEVTAEFPKSERQVAEAMKYVASFIPTSKGNESAFIVKYSGYTKKKNYPDETRVLRTPEEIAIKFISGSFATFEHIFPKNPIKGAKGPTTFWNGIEECASCNNKRQSTPFYEYIPNEHPEMPKNSQTYINEVIRDLNAGMHPEYRNWPYEVTPTLEWASRGLVKLDLSALKYKPSDDIKSILAENFKVISPSPKHKH